MDIFVPNETINIFLARINDFMPGELKDRIIKGRKAIELNKMNIGDEDEK